MLNKNDLHFSRLNKGRQRKQGEEKDKENKNCGRESSQDTGCSGPQNASGRVWILLICPNGLKGAEQRDPLGGLSRVGLKTEAHLGAFCPPLTSIPSWALALRLAANMDLLQVTQLGSLAALKRRFKARV